MVSPLIFDEECKRRSSRTTNAAGGDDEFRRNHMSAGLTLSTSATQRYPRGSTAPACWVIS
jgi:hypothetical protein